MDKGFRGEAGLEALPLREAVVDVDGSAWDKKIEEVIQKYEHIIALRGAGSWNGMDKNAAEEILENELIPRIKKDLESGSVAIMYDGDDDSLEKPDIGYIMGRLRDAFANESDQKVLFLAAQKRSWYYPSEPGKNLANAHGRQYETFVFEDGKFPGEHSRFTQSETLVNAPGYEQWYIGASGQIASEQLGDFSSKVNEGKKRKAVVFRAPINEAIAGEIENKLETARGAGDEAKIQRFQMITEQRKNKYGAHWDNEGRSKIDTSKYPNLDFEFVAD